ncbi:amino acid ABC transporter substrate-binding protein [Bradyrhizobium sp. RDT10]
MFAKSLAKYFVVAGLLHPIEASAQELTGTLKKLKETGEIAIGHRETLAPFSYFDDKQQVVGYSADLCAEILPIIRRQIKLPDLKVKLVPVTSSSRIPLLANGTIDLECGATTNNVDRQRQVSFSFTHFVTSNRFVSKKSEKLSKFEDLKGRNVVSVSGTTNIKQLTELNAQMDLGMLVMPVKDHAEAFLMVETDRSVAFVMDDVILAGLVANAKDPAAYEISKEPLSLEPYAFMVRREDPTFKAVVDGALADIFNSGKIKTIYTKWFEQPIPPKNINLHMPMSESLSKIIAKPTDSADPDAYR